MGKETSDLANFRKSLTKSLVDFIDDIMTTNDWMDVRGAMKSVQKVNYRVDRQGDVLQDPLRWRMAI